MSEEINQVHIKTHDEWLKYYKNATKEQVIEDLTRDVQYFADAVKDIKDLQQKVEQLEKEVNEYHKGLFKIKKSTFDGRLLLKDVVKLEKENKILRENAEQNDKVVDKVNWENMLLKGKLKELKDRIMLKQLRLVNEETYNVLHSDLNELLEVLDREIKYEQ